MAALTLCSLSLSTPRILANGSDAPNNIIISIIPWSRKQCGRMVVRRPMAAAKPELSEKVAESIKVAEAACAAGDAVSGECAAAWDEVEELSAAVSHEKDKNNDSDPLEEYCKDNPATDECRTYDRYTGDKSMADDVAVDAEGNAYITDVNKSKIWKVGVTGEYLSKIESPLFSPTVWYHNLITLNGIVYHPNDYLLVSHTTTGHLFKVDIKNDNEVKLVKMIGNSLSFTDGLELLSPNKLVVTGNPRISLVGSDDDWETATILEKASVVKHRLATAVTVMNEKVYVNHLFGMGYPKKKHVLAEAVFTVI